MIIDGKKQANEILKELKSLIKEYNLSPELVIVQVGDDPASNVYINNKLKKARYIGVKTGTIQISSSVSTESLLLVIDKLNRSADLDGFIVQLPLPAHIDSRQIIAAIDPSKDIDGFHPVNMGYLATGLDCGFIPCTPLGCLKLIKSVLGDIRGKHAVVVGRSNIVGRPLSLLLLQEDCTVTICHSATHDLKSHTKVADIVITAIGKPHFFGPEYFNERAVVIDVGINTVQTEQGPRITGDVDFAAVAPLVRAITPVPGGVGPMTVAHLLRNLVKAHIQRLEDTSEEENSQSRISRVWHMLLRAIALIRDKLLRFLGASR